MSNAKPHINYAVVDCKPITIDQSQMGLNHGVFTRCVQLCSKLTLLQCFLNLLGFYLKIC